MLCLGACQFARPQDVPDVDAATDAPIDSAGPLFTVGGTVSGMWSGASVQLTLTALPDQPVAVTVDASGSFTTADVAVARLDIRAVVHRLRERSFTTADDAVARH